MFNQSKGTINDKKNRRLREFLRLKKKKLEDRVIIEKKEKEKLEKKKKEIYIPELISKEDKKQIGDSTNHITKTKIKKTKGKHQNTKQDLPLPISPIVKEEEIKKTEEISQKPKIDESLEEQTISKRPAKKGSSSNSNKKSEQNKPQRIESTKNDQVKTPLKTTSTQDNSKKIDATGEEELLELALANEFEVILKDHQYDINKLIVEFNILNEQVEKTVETDKLEKMSKEIDELVRKLEIIKRELEVLTYSATFKNIYKLHDPYLTNIIDKYRDSLTQDEQLLDTVNQIETSKLYKSIINKIIEFETEKDKLNEELNETKEKYKIRDENFEKWKDNYIDVEKFTKLLNELVNTSNQKLKEIEEKVAKSVNVVEIVETKMKSSLGIISKTLLLMSLLKRNPTRQANGLAAISTLTAFSLINDLIKPKKVTTKHIQTDLIDYRNMITNTINDVDNIHLLINNSLSEIQKLKVVFEKEFKEYQYDFSEYKEFINKLDNVEKEMIDRKNNMNKISGELAFQYDKNNEKVKKYSSLS